MAKRKTLEEIAADLYDDDELAAAVVGDVDAHTNREKILAGELSLPSPHDARIWHDRVTGKVSMTPLERSQAAIIESMDARLAALEAAQRGVQV